MSSSNPQDCVAVRGGLRSILIATFATGRLDIGYVTPDYPTPSRKLFALPRSPGHGPRSFPLASCRQLG
jgi:hypothetical protein